VLVPSIVVASARINTGAAPAAALDQDASLLELCFSEIAAIFPSFAGYVTRRHIAALSIANYPALVNQSSSRF
jgi:hypothetical protein